MECLLGRLLHTSAWHSFQLHAHVHVQQCLMSQYFCIIVHLKRFHNQGLKHCVHRYDGPSPPSTPHQQHFRLWVSSAHSLNHAPDLMPVEATALAVLPVVGHVGAINQDVVRSMTVIPAPPVPHTWQLAAPHPHT